MPTRSRLPLAWLNLVHNRGRLLVSATGIAFAVVLIHLEIGFLDAMYEAQVAMLRLLDADVIICSRAKQSMVINEPFTRRRLYQAEAVAGVESAHPLYVEF